METRPGLGIVFGLALTLPAFADDPLACVDPAVSDTLLSKPREGPYQVTRDLPQGFPSVVIPDEFQLIGSRSSPHRSTTAFKTSLSPAQALAQLESVGAEAGFRRSSEEESPEARGFMFAELPALEESVTLCADDAQSGIGATAFPGHGGITYVTVVPFDAEPYGWPCSTAPHRPVAHHQMPRLRMPSYGNGAPSGSSATLKTTESADRVIGDFERQLVEQQWRRESRWADQRIIGSTWVSSDGSTAGLLTVMSTERGIYRLRFAASAIERGQRP